MEKKQTKTKQKASPLALHRETLRRLESSELQGVVGGARIRVPVGVADDTTPIYSEVEEP